MTQRNEGAAKGSHRTNATEVICPGVEAGSDAFMRKTNLGPRGSGPYQGRAPWDRVEVVPTTRENDLGLCGGDVEVAPTVLYFAIAPPGRYGIFQFLAVGA